MSNFRTLGTTILILTVCCGAAAAQSGTVSLTLSSAYNCDLLGTDGEIAAANAWGALHPSSDCTIFDVFGGHFGMNNYSDRICYYVNDACAVPTSGIINTSYATYQLGPVALATSATTPANFVPSPNVIIFGKSLDGLKTVTVNLPQAQQRCYSSVNFLLVYWHLRGTPSNQSMSLSACYQDGTTEVLYTGTIPGWNSPGDSTFRVARACTACIGYANNFTRWYSETWNPSQVWAKGVTCNIFEFSPSFLPPTCSTKVLTGFQFAAIETGSGAESLAAIMAGAGCPAPGPPSGVPEFTVSLSRSWVYQNTPGTLSRGGHFSNLTVTITNANGNSSFTSSVQSMTGSGGQVTVLSTSNALAWVIQGGSRTDGSSGTGAMTLQVAVQGNSGGPSTQQIAIKVRPLGDITGTDTVGSNDLIQMNHRLDSFPAPYDDAAFDLDGNGVITTDDRVLLNRILNNLPVP